MRIEIKPRLKYDLIISIRVLRYAEDHHHLFIPWARRMRRGFSERTLSDATLLIDVCHEWQLCSLMQDHDGPDTISALTEYVAIDAGWSIRRWAAPAGPRGLSAGQKRFANDAFAHTRFPQWFAGFLARYYEEGFERDWPAEHRILLLEDPARTARELESGEFSYSVR